MPTVKHDAVSVKDVVERAKSVLKVTTDKEFSELLGISSADFGNRKKRGTLLPLIVVWAANENVDLNYLVTGKTIRASDFDPDPEIASLVEGARRVLTSGDPVAIEALERNIKYYDRAITAEKRAEDSEKEIKEMKEELERLKLENKRLDEEDQAPSSNEKAA